MTDDEMFGWHHRLSGYESELTPGDGEGQGGLVCCSAWGHKESMGSQRGGHYQATEPQQQG